MASRRSHSARRRRSTVAGFQQTPKSESQPAPAPTQPQAQPQAPKAKAKPTAGGGTGARRPGSSRSGRASAKGLQVDRDGKAVVACPQCSTKYRVPEDRLDNKIQCNNCQRAFFPKAAAKARKSQENPAMPFIIGGGVLVLVIIIGVIVSNLGPVKIEYVAQPEPPKRPDITWQHPRVQMVADWTRAVSEEGPDGFNLGRLSDINALQGFLSVPADGADLKLRVLQELKTCEAGWVIRDFEPYNGSLLDESMHDSDTGTAEIYLQPRPGTLHDTLAKESMKKEGARYYGRYFEPIVEVTFRMEGTDVKVTGFKATRTPKKPAPRGRVDKPHATIAKPEEVERVIDGQKVKVRESALSPLGHLDDTPEPMRQEIDKLISDLLDLEAPGYLSNRCINALKKIGRPAIPRLLNKMYEIEPKTQDDRYMLRRIVQALSQVSGVRKGFNVADNADVTGEMNQAQRMSALKQWYAWWYERHDEAFDTAIDKEDDETLLLTEAEKAAMKKAKEASATKTPAKKK